MPKSELAMSRESDLQGRILCPSQKNLSKDKIDWKVSLLDFRHSRNVSGDKLSMLLRLIKGTG